MRLAQPRRLDVARALPRVELETLEGLPVRLEAQLMGRPAVVSLWATWCEACASEFDSLARLSRRATGEGGMVVAIAIGESRQKVGEFVKWRGLAYPQLVDEHFRFADALGSQRVPTTLVVDRRGQIVFTGGALDESALAALASALR